MKFLEVLQMFGIIHIFLTERLLHKRFHLLSLHVCFAVGNYYKKKKKRQLFFQHILGTF